MVSTSARGKNCQLAVVEHHHHGIEWQQTTPSSQSVVTWTCRAAQTKQWRWESVIFERKYWDCIMSLLWILSGRHRALAIECRSSRCVAPSSYWNDNDVEMESFDRRRGSHLNRMNAYKEAYRPFHRNCMVSFVVLYLNLLFLFKQVVGFCAETLKYVCPYLCVQSCSLLPILHTNGIGPRERPSSATNAIYCF